MAVFTMSLNETPTQRFFTRFYRAGRALTRTLEATLSENLSLEMQDFMVLGTIAKGHRHPGAIAERLHASKFAVSRTLQKLQERGLIERTIDPDDSRRILLTPTEKGLMARSAAIEAMENRLEPLLEKLGDEQAECLINALEQLTGSITEPGSTSR